MGRMNSLLHHMEIDSLILKELLKKGKVRMAGNEKLKIYGTLQCKSGKRMKRENRVFFSSKEAAIIIGYRPCGNCMKEEYQNWKNGLV